MVQEEPNAPNDQRQEREGPEGLMGKAGTLQHKEQQEESLPDYCQPP